MMNKTVKYLLIGIFVLFTVWGCKKESKYVRIDGHFMNKDENWVMVSTATDDEEYFMRYEHQLSDGKIEVLYMGFKGPNTRFLKASDPVPSSIDIK